MCVNGGGVLCQKEPSTKEASISSHILLSPESSGAEVGAVFSGSGKRKPDVETASLVIDSVWPATGLASSGWLPSHPS